MVNAKDFHRTLKNDLISRYPMRNMLHAQKLFDKWRHHYNHVRPHEALDLEVPASLYQASKKQMPYKLPSIEYSYGAIVRKARGNGYISYNHKEYLIGEGFKGSLIEIKHDEDDNCIDLYFGKFKIYTHQF